MAMGQYGFWNKILHVDLSRRETRIEEPGPAFYRHYGGGRGFIAHFILKYVPEGAEPLGPNNVLVFAPGVVTGAPVPGAGRHSVGAMSPLTGGYGEAESGGYWGAELKRAGWDAIVVHGQAETPVYLWINGDAVEIRDASHLWGKVTGDAEETIIEEVGDSRARVAQIGPAGENLVRFAAIGNDLNEFAGRTGMGAVMGSKKLKAIAVRGRTPVPMADQKVLTGIAKWVSSTMEQNHRSFHEFGTGDNMQGKSLQGGLPALNYRLGQDENVGLIDARAIRDQVRQEMKACYACSVRCKKVVRIEQSEEDAHSEKGERIAVDPLGRYRVDPKYGGPEYESLASLGSNLGIQDIVAVCKSNEICNYLGMDTISAGATIAFAMECYEKGLLTKEDTGGIELNFHDPAVVVQLLEMIGHREGYGDLLAEGSQRVAERLGQGSEAFLTTVKGLELAMHDPRQAAGMRGSYLLAPTGGDHMGQHDTKGGMRNVVGMCHFLRYDEQQTLDILNAATGWGVNQDDYFELARRTATLARLIDVRSGFTRKDDAFPARFHEDLPMHKGVTAEQEAAIVEEFYGRYGWAIDTGIPTRTTVRALGIEEDARTVAESLPD